MTYNIRVENFKHIYLFDSKTVDLSPLKSILIRFPHAVELPQYSTGFYNKI